MKKKLLAGLATGLMMFGVVGAAEATSFTWFTPGVLSITLNYPESTQIGSTVAGYEVTEIEYAKYGLSENTWQGSSYPGGGVWGDSNGSHSVWLFNGDVYAAFSTASTAVAFSAGGDHNDGNTNFYVDNTLITTQNMNNFGGTLLVEGLDNIAHTVRVTGTTHLEGAAELAPVPEPATMLLMGTGLAGLVGARRKKKK